MATLKSSKMHWLGLIKGGPGSGNHGHCGGEGGPGNPGGSKPADECGGAPSAARARAAGLSDEFYDWLEKHLESLSDADLNDWWKHRQDKKYDLLGLGKLRIDNYFAMSTAKIDEMTRNFDLGLSFFARNKSMIESHFKQMYVEAFRDADWMADEYPETVADRFLWKIEDGVQRGLLAPIGVTKANELEVVMAMAGQLADTLRAQELEKRDYWAKGAGKISLDDILPAGKAEKGERQGAQPAMQALASARAKYLMGPDGNFDEASKNYSEYWKSWLVDSQSPLGHWMAHVASRELGAPAKMRGKVDDTDVAGEYAGVMDFLNKKYDGAGASPLNDTRYKDDAAMVRATYEVSQLALRDEPEDMMLFRGIKPREDEDIDFTVSEHDALMWKTDIMLKSSSLQSATTRFESAADFGRIQFDHEHYSEIKDMMKMEYEDGSEIEFGSPVMVVGVDIPKAKIFSVPSFGANDALEEEYVILGGDWDEKSRVFLFGLGNSFSLTEQDAANFVEEYIKRQRKKRGK